MVMIKLSPKPWSQIPLRTPYERFLDHLRNGEKSFVRRSQGYLWPRLYTFKSFCNISASAWTEMVFYNLKSKPVLTLDDWMGMILLTFWLQLSLQVVPSGNARVYFSADSYAGREGERQGSRQGARAIRQIRQACLRRILSSNQETCWYHHSSRCWKLR